MIYRSPLKCHCPKCGAPLARVFWQEDGQGGGEWMGTCLNPRCSCCASTIVATGKPAEDREGREVAEIQQAILILAATSSEPPIS